MPNIIVYLNEELYQKFRKEENKSGLISGLLEDFYNKTIRPNISEIKESLEKAKLDVDKFSEIKNKIEVENHVKELSEKEKLEKEKSRVMSKIESVRKNASAFFLEFSKLDVYSQNLLIDEYLSQQSLNLVQFFISKNFKDNIVEDVK